METDPVTARTSVGGWSAINDERVKLIRVLRTRNTGSSPRRSSLNACKLHAASPGSSNLHGVADLTESFLRHSRLNLAADTHRINRYYGQLFAERHGAVTANDIKPFHISAWIDHMRSPERVAAKPIYRPWGETTIFNAKKLVARIFSWSVAEGVIPANPLAKMPLDKPAPRRRALTTEEFQALYDRAEVPFANFLKALWETGARPHELRNLRWEQVRDDRWILGKHKTARSTGKERVIYPPAAVRELVESLRGNGSEYVFLNTRGRPWTGVAVRKQVHRLKTTLGLSKDVCAYLCRHGFGTRAIMRGINPATVAELMGHASLDMVSKVYVHLAGERAPEGGGQEDQQSHHTASARPGQARRRAPRQKLLATTRRRNQRSSFGVAPDDIPLPSSI